MPDPAAPAHLERRRRQHWTLGLVCLATFMLLLDITVVNVALPEIERSLGASFSDLQWVIDAYALTLASFVLAAGSLADRLGRRRIFVGGLGLFTAASLACGLAGTPGVLITSRAFQGVGGAMMFATALALLAQEFRGKERGFAFGIWGATTGAAVAIGPLVGGALTDSLGWEWIFIVNVPLGLLAIPLSLARVGESRDSAARRPDWAGTATFSAAQFLLVYALIRGNDEGWDSTPILAMLIGFAVLLAGFLVIERRHPHPMLDLRLFRTPTFTGAQIVAFVLSAAMFAMFLYLTLYVQGVLGFGPLEAGLRFLPVTLLSFLVAPAAGKLSERFPAKGFLALGLALIGVGLLLMSGLSVDSEWTALLAGFMVAGVGIGLVNPPLASTAVSVVEPAQAGAASGINSTFRQVGIATGIAALGAIFESRVEARADELFAAQPAVSAPHGFTEAISSGAAGRMLGGAPPGSRDALLALADDAFVTALNEILVIAALFAFAGALLAAILIRQRDLVRPSAHGGAPEDIRPPGTAGDTVLPGPPPAATPE